MELDLLRGIRLSSRRNLYSKKNAANAIAGALLGLGGGDATVHCAEYGY
jgi:hypothetical protein